MCYMNYIENHIGIRRLRENLSVYLGRVRQGADGRIRLIAEGRLIARLKESRELPPPIDDPGLRPTSEILDELREDRL